MPLNPDAVGTTSEPSPVSWTSKDALLYAVGVGAGREDLAFTTENSNGIAQQVLPTFPVVLSSGGAALGNIGTFNPAMLVHGTQSITLHQPLKPNGSADVTVRVANMWDKGKAGVVVLEANASDDEGMPLWTAGMSLFIRGEGGWGGERGPSGAQNVPPERDPDAEVTFQTTENQALIYRLSGDRNPLHSDPTFAAAGGFPMPILHGLCTYGFTGRALLSALCNNDATKFAHMEGRFASPVFPGEALTVRIWTTGENEAVFTTSVGDRVVLDQGLCRFR